MKEPLRVLQLGSDINKTGFGEVGDENNVTKENRGCLDSFQMFFTVKVCLFVVRPTLFERYQERPHLGNIYTLFLA